MQDFRLATGLVGKAKGPPCPIRAGCGEGPQAPQPSSRERGSLVLLPAGLRQCRTAHRHPGSTPMARGARPGAPQAPANWSR